MNTHTTLYFFVFVYSTPYSLAKVKKKKTSSLSRCQHNNKSYDTH